MMIREIVTSAMVPHQRLARCAFHELVSRHSAAGAVDTGLGSI
jgi:hypothetical protein